MYSQKHIHSAIQHATLLSTVVATWDAFVLSFSFDLLADEIVSTITAFHRSYFFRQLWISNSVMNFSWILSL